MAYQEIKNVRIAGISACVPLNKEINIDYPHFQSSEDAKRFIDSTGVEERRVTSDALCSSDLCFHAAEKLLSESDWDRNDIDCVIFISQTPDYIVPMTAGGLQHRLGLSEECYCFDVTLGCSAWVYGLSIMGSLLSSGSLKKGLLLVGETTSKTKSKTDKSTYPLFGDAGSATLLSFDETSPPMFFQTGTDGSKQKAIYIPDGGFRSPTTLESLVVEEITPGVTRNRLQYIMDGGQVFTFTITKVPKSIKGLMERLNLTPEDIDYFLLHQANNMIIDKIASKIKAPDVKVPRSLQKFGNTSCSSLPLTFVTNLCDIAKSNKLKFIASGFGSGLSLASAYIITDHIFCPDLIEIEG